MQGEGTGSLLGAVALSSGIGLHNSADCWVGADERVHMQIQQLAKQVLGGCEQKGTEKLQLDYDPRNPFDICSATFTPIYRGNPYAEDPYTKAR